LSESSASVESLAVPPDADPALDALDVSQIGALPGSTVVVTATVRNVGRGRALGMQVGLFAGQPGSGTPLASLDLPDGLDMNETLPVTFSVVVPSGAFPVYAQLTSSGANVSTANDQAALTLSDLAPPSVVTAAESAVYKGALELSWLPSTAPSASGYRVLRSTSAAGPFAFVGEARGSGYTDTLLKLQQGYCYVVQAYSADGRLSAPSETACALVVGEPTYLPLLGRA
jgi:hypothetical protein